MPPQPLRGERLTVETSPGVTLVLAGLTAARVTRLIVRDQFPPVLWARERIEERGPEWLADLVTCPWCASAYVSAGVVALLWLAPGVAAPVLTAGAVWAISSALAYWQGRAEDREDDHDAEQVTLQMRVVDNGKVDA